MDDYFSGLIRPHIDDMKLDEEDWGSDNKEDKRESPEPATPTVNTPEDQSDGGSTDDQTYQSDESTPNDNPTTKTKSSTTSSSSSSDRDAKESLEGPSTLDEFRVPLINYERDYPNQSLVAMIGREFDEPWVISASLQALAKGAAIDGEPSKYPKIKFVPYTVRRNVLTKGSIDPKDISKHDVICMCYNASEARIMLTGRDGYYTELLKHVEALHGSNRGSFIITHYTAPGKELQVNSIDENTLISTALKDRLAAQNELSPYLDNNQVLSWYDQPHKGHVLKLQSLAHTDPNPQGYLRCTLL